VVSRQQLIQLGGFLRVFQHPEDSGNCFYNLGWSPDGTFLAAACGNPDAGKLLVWHVSSGQLDHSLEQPAVVYSVSGSANKLISGDGDWKITWRRIGIDGKSHVMPEKAHEGTVRALSVSPDGSLLASCGDDGTIKLWALADGQRLHTLLRDRPYERLNIMGIRGLTQAEITTLRALRAIEDAAAESL